MFVGALSKSNEPPAIGRHECSHNPTELAAGAGQAGSPGGVGSEVAQWQRAGPITGGQWIGTALRYLPFLRADGEHPLELGPENERVDLACFDGDSARRGIGS